MTYQDPASRPNQPYQDQQQYPTQPYGGQPYGTQPYGSPPPATQKTNTLAIIALVLAFFVSLGGVICGHIALAQIKRTGEQGRGLAIAALVLGYIGIALGLLFLLVYVIAIASAVSSGALSS